MWVLPVFIYDSGDRDRRAVLLLTLLFVVGFVSANPATLTVWLLVAGGSYLILLLVASIYCPALLASRAPLFLAAALVEFSLQGMLLSAAAIRRRVALCCLSFAPCILCTRCPFYFCACPCDA